MNNLNLDKFFKYYNIFTFLYMRYFLGKKNVRLKTVYQYTAKCAEKTASFSSTWDVFDGIMWICAYVSIITLIGYLGG